MKIFDIINQINNKTKKYKYDKKVAPAYMLSQWLSHDQNLIGIVQDITKNGLQFNLSDNLIYDYYYSKVPQKRRFIKWTKKDKKNKKDEKRVDELKIQYNLSKNEAMMVLKHEKKLN